MENRIEMTASRAGKPSSSAQVGVSWSDGLIRLRDEDLFGNRLGDLCVVFLRRIFALDEIKWVEIDRDRSTAEIRYDPGPLGLTDLLHRLATAIRGQFPPDASQFSDSFVPQDLSRSVGRVKIQRFGTILTTWDIVDYRPGRIRLRHEAIRGDAAAQVGSRTPSRMSLGFSSARYRTSPAACSSGLIQV